MWLEYFFRSLKPNGWFYHDILLYLFLFFFLLLLLILFIRHAKPKTYLSFICFYLIISFFVFLIFGAFGLHINYSSESDIFYDEEQKHLLSLVRASVPNGTENGISTSVSHFQLILLDTDSGEKVWTKRLTWRHYLLGETSDYVIMNNPDKNWLYFLDIKTGKRVYSQKDLENKNKQLSGILSKDFIDYMVKDDLIYMHGNDNQYYTIQVNTLTLSKITKEEFLKESKVAVDIDIPYTDTEALETILINPVVLSEAGDNQFYVLSSQKLHDAGSYINLYDASTQTVLSQTSIDFSSEDTMEKMIDTTDCIYLQGNGKLYRYNKTTNDIDYVFSYRWNELE